MIAWLSDAIDVATSPIVSSRRSMISAIAWSMNAIAKVVTSMTAGDWPRSGRKTTALHRERQRDDDDEAGGDAPRRPASAP